MKRLPLGVTVALVIIAALVVGALVLKTITHLLWWAVMGLVLGALARAILPGRQNVGIIATALLGVGGALAGGVIAAVIGVGTLLQFAIALGAATGFVAIASGRETRRLSRGV